MTFAVTLGLDTLSFMLALLLVTLGLVVIFGLMNVINMAHGEFFLISAYCVVLIQKIGLSYWWAVLLAPAVLIAVGLIVEELVIRHIYRRFIQRRGMKTFALDKISIDVDLCSGTFPFKFCWQSRARPIRVGVGFEIADVTHRQVE